MKTNFIDNIEATKTPEDLQFEKYESLKLKHNKKGRQYNGEMTTKKRKFDLWILVDLLLKSVDFHLVYKLVLTLIVIGKITAFPVSNLKTFR